MQLRQALQGLGIAIAATFTTGAVSGCAGQEGIEAQVHESKYSIALPLQHGGEHIDFLVRVESIERPYQFNLVFVEPRDWHEKRKDQLWRLFHGHLIGDAETTDYPVKLRIRIDSVGNNTGRPVHIDHQVSERSSLYGQGVGNTTWRALAVYESKFQPGIYRVRVDNLAPAPQLDFETLFLFERDNRQY